MSTPHRNGDDPELRSEAERARVDFVRLPAHEALGVAYANAHLAKWGMQRYASVVVDMDGKLGRVAVEVGALAGNAGRLANIAEARIGALDAKLDERCDRLEQAIAQRFAYNPDASARLPSITDEIENEDTAVRAVALRVRAKDAEVFAEVKAQLAQMQQAKHDAEVAAAALANKAKLDEETAQRSVQRLKTWIAIIIGIGTILGGALTVGAYVYGRVELRQTPTTAQPTK